MAEAVENQEVVANTVVVEAEEVKVYGSVDELFDDGISTVEYKEIDGFSPGKKIRIGSVSAGEMIEFQDANEKDEKVKRDAGLRLICKSLVDEKGRRYASDVHLIDNYVRRFRSMRHNVTNRIVDAILDLNEMNLRQERKGKNA